MNHFALFALEPAYAIDLEDLNQRYLKLQQATHPDKHSAASAHERMLAAQMSANINEAMQILKDDVSRAEYLLTLQGADVKARHTINDVNFLQEQMALREQLDQAKTEESLLAIIDNATEQLVNTGKKFNKIYQNHPDDAIALVQQMKFFKRLGEQADSLL